MVAISELLAFYTLKVKTFRHATWRREKPMASKPLSGETTKIDKQLNLRACIWRDKIWKCHSPFSHVGESDRSKSLGRSSIFYQFYEIKTCIIHVYTFILYCYVIKVFLSRLFVRFLHPSFKDPTGMAMFASMARKERHTWRKLREQMEQMRVAPFEACACAGKGVFDDNLRVIVHAYLMLFDCLCFN